MLSRQLYKKQRERTCLTWTASELVPPMGVVGGCLCDQSGKVPADAAHARAMRMQLLPVSRRMLVFEHVHSG